MVGRNPVSGKRLQRQSAKEITRMWTTLLLCLQALMENAVANPKPPLERIAGSDLSAAQEPSTQAVVCGICGKTVGLEKCKVDEAGVAVHARCYFEKVSAQNGAKNLNAA